MERGFVMVSASKPDEPDWPSDAICDLDEARRALRTAREREAILRNELSHRVRNILAVTRSIFSRTIETADSLDHVSDHFRGRLDALARYHGRVASLPDADFDLEDMVRDEMLAVRSADDDRVEVAGPDVRLSNRRAETMGLALHELTTNSVKFGVLGHSEGPGELRISWSVEGEFLDFTWRERGVAIVASAPLPIGFGREFIEQALPYQLDAETSFSIVPGGLDCRIRFRLTDQDVTDPYRPMKR
jgi:two-component system CheB/CheR fusion protein